MYDIEKISKIIQDIKMYKKELEGLEIKDIKDLDNSKNLYAASMLCFSVLNRVIDLGEEILIKEDIGMPSRYSEIFEKLSKAGVMNKKEASEIIELINYRNIIAHSYFELGKKDIFKIIKKMNIIDSFIDKIRKRVRIK